mmetsp:Transcript_90103/g.250749  ORF Transcript_90103/g.250749 Transcript_90103/m.250749 type:complete len:216 (+) Transcript_90103:642-1289(+)
MARRATSRFPRFVSAPGPAAVAQMRWTAASGTGRSGANARSVTVSGSGGGASSRTPRTAEPRAGPSMARRCSLARGSAVRGCIAVGRRGGHGAVARCSAGRVANATAAGPWRSPARTSPARARRRGRPSGATTCSTARRRRSRTTTSPRSPWPSSAAPASPSSAWRSSAAPASPAAAASAPLPPPTAASPAPGPLGGPHRSPRLARRRRACRSAR